MSDQNLSNTQMLELKARKRRNLAIAGALVLFVVLVFVVTIVRLGSAAMHHV
jgi:hypothetical protein